MDYLVTTEGETLPAGFKVVAQFKDATIFEPGDEDYQVYSLYQGFFENHEDRFAYLQAKGDDSLNNQEEWETHFDAKFSNVPLIEEGTTGDYTFFGA